MINGGSGWDLKIADENGANAFRIYGGSTSVAFDLSSSGSDTAAIIDRGVAKVINWSVGPSGSVTANATPINTAPAQAMSLAFSQDGTKLAVFTSPDKIMRIYDVATLSEIASWPARWAFDISWWADGTGLVINAHNEVTSKYELVSYGADGSNPTVLGEFNSLEDIDASRSSDSRAVLVSFGTSTDIRISQFENSSLTGYILAYGYAQSWRCDGKRFVYQKFSTGGASNPWFFQDIDGASSTFSKITKIRRVRYMKCPRG
jgi:hypothetical protein